MAPPRRGSDTMPYTWQTTKTDWVSTDAWSVDGANRIDNNTRYLAERFSAELGVFITLDALTAVTRSDAATDTMLNLFDRNLNTVKVNWLTPAGWQTLNEAWNSTPITHAEVNAWEANLQRVKDKLDIFVLTVMRVGAPLAIAGRRIGGI